MKISHAQWNVQESTFRFLFSEGGITQINETALKNFATQFQQKQLSIPGITFTLENDIHSQSVSYIRLNYEAAHQVMDFFNHAEVKALLTAAGFSPQNIQDIQTQLQRGRPASATSNAQILSSIGHVTRTISAPETVTPAPEAKPATHPYGRGCG